MIANAALPVFVTVTVCAALFVPTVWLLNVNDAGLTPTTGVTPTPVPARFTTSGLLASLSVIVTAAALVPVAVGVNVALIVQFPPAASELPQVFVAAKSPLSVPVTAIPLMAKADAPLLVSVVLCALLVDPTVWFPKLKLLLDRLTFVAWVTYPP